MFIGHYGVAFAAKAVAPRVPLGITFLAVQWLDVMFSLFVFAGIEHMRIVPGYTQYNPYVLEYTPYTHGLAGSLCWSAAGGAAWLLARRNMREALVVAGAVFSHFLLDVPVHTPDMPLLGEDSYKLGLGLWNHWLWALAFELVMLIGGWAIWMIWRRPDDSPRPREIVFLAALVLLTIATPFLPAPSSPDAFGVQALIFYGVLAGLAQLTERNRLRQRASAAGHPMSPAR
ncbi:MAG: hypothetical protein ACXWKC_18395 [Xanthobacteraceae bacterium]